MVGDIIFDQYIYGVSTRLSPEAPVPIFIEQKRDFRMGGAANVFHTVNALNGNVKLCGIIGNDTEGDLLKKHLLKFNESGDMLISSNRPTTAKIRLICNRQHVLRIDREEVADVNSEFERKIIKLIENNIKHYKILILSDYHKGLLSYGLAQRIIKICNSNNVQVLVDAKKDFSKYEHSFLIKPNRNDLIKLMGCNIHYKDDEIIQYCKNLLKECDIKYIYLTLGEEGGVLIDKNSNKKIPSFLNECFVDATGAGDTTIAALAVALLADLSVADAAFFASYVAGISVTKDKTNCVVKEDLLRYARYI